MVESGIYAIVNTTNGKQYIGSTNNLDKRKYEHFLFLRNKTHGNPHLQYSYNKNSKKFEFRVLEKVDTDILIPQEQYWIDQAKGLGIELYNVCLVAGSPAASVMTEEHKRKIGLANKGKHRSAETKEKLRQYHLGKKASIETKEKLRKIHLGSKRPISFSQGMSGQLNPNSRTNKEKRKNNG